MIYGLIVVWVELLVLEAPLIIIIMISRKTVTQPSFAAIIIFYVGSGVVLSTLITIILGNLCTGELNNISCGLRCIVLSTLGSKLCCYNNTAVGAMRRSCGLSFIVCTLIRSNTGT